ncbi:MAG: hypothetical protein P9M05_03580 [Candidatus Stygibacter australis]|nr:hypothetical protein [Candidatus Stygibacter australis]
MKFPWYIWIPRILIILVSLFAAMFSLDVFEGSASLGQQLLGLLMHNIPVLLILLTLILTWKRPLVAGIVFGSLTLIFIILLAIYFKKFFWWDMLMFILPLLICVGLFFLTHFKVVNPKSTGEVA